MATLRVFCLILISIFVQICANPRVNIVEAEFGHSDHVEDTSTNHVNYDHITYQQIAEEFDRDVNARCVFCKFFVEKIRSALEGAAAKGTIDKFVDNACRSIINTTICDFLATRVTNYIENLINNDLEPDTACVASGFCPAEFYVPNYEDIIQTQDLNSPFGCKICTYFVTKLNEFMEGIAARLERYLYPYCDRLPAPTNKECRDAVKRLVEGIVTRYASVQAVCNKAVKACP